MKSATDILAAVQDIEELRAGQRAVLERCEAMLAELDRARQRAQEASQELRAWGDDRTNVAGRDAGQSAEPTVLGVSLEKPIPLHQAHAQSSSADGEANRLRRPDRQACE